MSSRQVSMQFGKPGTVTQGSSGSGGGLSIDLLWTNPSPTASFAAQNLSIDLTGYSYYGMILKYQHSQEVYSPIYFYPVNEHRNFAMLVYGGNGNRNGDRRFTYNSTNKQISFETATYNGSNNNQYCIPYQIFGIR